MAICGAAITLTGLFLVVGPTVTTAGASSPPEPNIGHFVPASAQVTGVRQIHMTRSGPAQLVVAYQSAQTNADGFTTRDLIVLTWDHFAKRWVVVWDGAKTPGQYAGGGQSLAQDAVFPTDVDIFSLSFWPAGHPRFARRATRCPSRGGLPNGRRRGSRDLD